VRLVFDGRFIQRHPDGITKFSLGLIHELKKLVPLTVLVHADYQREQIGSGVEFLQGRAATSLLEPFTSLLLNRAGADVVFSPMQTTSGLFKKYKLVLTIHDLIYYRYKTPPAQFNPVLRGLWWLYHQSYLPQRLVLRAADAVATVSNTSREQILQAKLTKKPIWVIPNASDLPVLEPLPKNKQLVYMGSFIGYKNVETLVRAMSDLPDYELALLSKISPKRKAELQALIPKGARVSFIGGVTNQEYATYLAEGFALVSASLDEGFGIPALESISQGTPAVLSDLEIFREVAGDGAIYFDPKDPSDFVRAVRELEHPQVYRATSLAGVRQAAGYSWKVSAQKLLVLLKSL
jgi:glycosyltransferase involved in cell wall biosynthesis